MKNTLSNLYFSIASTNSNIIYNKAMRFQLLKMFNFRVGVFVLDLTGSVFITFNDLSGEGF